MRINLIDSVTSVVTDYWYILIPTFILYGLIKAIGKHPGTSITSHWHKSFREVDVGVKDFYEKVFEKTNELGLPRKDAGIERVAGSDITGSKSTRLPKDFDASVKGLPESALLGRHREYLVIRYLETTLYVCASPFGAGFFFSYWMTERPSFGRYFLACIPIFGLPFRNLESASFYDVDSHQMFVDLVHTAILESVEEFTTGKEVFSDAERTPPPVMYSLGAR